MNFKKMHVFSSKILEQWKGVSHTKISKGSVNISETYCIEGKKEEMEWTRDKKGNIDWERERREEYEGERECCEGKYAGVGKFSCLFWGGGGGEQKSFSFFYI